VRDASSGKVAAAYVAVCLLAGAVNQYYGYLGYMPLDQSIVYNGAWRVLQGQVPYVDFWLPFGLVPILSQAALFALLGVSWTVYVLHASLVDAVFAAGVLLVGRRLGLRLGTATFYGAVAAIVAYPPMATPYIDQHASILSAALLGVVLLGILERQNESQTGRRWWLWAPPVGLLALFSKQAPSAYALLFSGTAILLAVLLQKRWRDLRAVAFSAIVWLIATVIALRGLGVTWEMFQAQTIETARAIAAERTFLSDAKGGWSELLLIVRVTGRQVRDVLLTGLFHVPVYSIAALPVIAALVAAWRSRRTDTVVLSLFAAGCFAIAIVFMALTFNQPVSSLALMAAAWLPAHAALARTASRLAVGAGGVALLVTLLIFVGWISPRYLNDFEDGVPPGVDAGTISPQLAHLRWSMPANERLGESGAENYRLLLAALATHPATPVIVSDSILYPLTGRAPVPPALFWHRKLSFPADGPAREAFDRLFRASIVKAGSDLVVMDGPYTWMFVALDEFPWLKRCLKSDGVQKIGRFSLIPLDPDCVARP
jgi:hypothetical protein